MNQPKLYTINQIKESENIYIKKNSLNKLFNNATTKIITFIKKNYTVFFAISKCAFLNIKTRTVWIKYLILR